MMTREELHQHQQDVDSGALQTVQAGGRVHVVKPDPLKPGRWTTISTETTMNEAAAYIEGYRAGLEAR